MEAVRRASRGMMGTTSDQPAASSVASTRVSFSSQDAEVAEADVEEAQPLLSHRDRVTSRQISQQQFQEAQQEAAQDAALSSGWFTWIVVLIGFVIFVAWFYVNMKSWYVLFEYYDSPCDQPLNHWLLVKLMIDVISSSVDNRRRMGDPPRVVTWLILGFQNCWLVLGFHWCGECKTCQSTSPEMYNWVQFLVIFGTVVSLLLMLVPVLFYMGVMILVHLIGTGRIKNQRAARPDTLTLLTPVEYSPELFADSNDANDDRPSRECCCCCEDFNDEKAILRTPCHHYFHKDCLGEWLALAKTCPICRCDLDIATEDAGFHKDAMAAGVLEEPENSTSAFRDPVHRPLAASASGARSSADPEP